MSYINTTNGKTFAPGWFLAVDYPVDRKTHQMAQSAATDDGNGGKYVPMGTVFPTNDENAIGIVYEDVDVSSGDMPGSVVTRGTVYEDRLPVAINANAKTALTARGFVFVANAPTVTRP